MINILTSIVLILLIIILMPYAFKNLKDVIYLDMLALKLSISIGLNILLFGSIIWAIVKAIYLWPNYIFEFSDVVYVLSLAVIINIIYLAFFHKKLIHRLIKQIKEGAVWKIEDLPSKYINEELASLAVSKDGYMLRYIPENIKTYYMCFSAIQNNEYLIDHVPDKFKTKELYIKLLEKNISHIRETPYNILLEIAPYANEKDIQSLKYIPEKLKTYELCLKFVENNGLALEYVPEYIKNTDLCLKATEQTKDAWRYFPEKLKTNAIRIQEQKIVNHEIINNFEKRLNIILEEYVNSSNIQQILDYSNWIIYEFNKKSKFAQDIILDELKTQVKESNRYGTNIEDVYSINELISFINKKDIAWNHQLFNWADKWSIAQSDLPRNKEECLKLTKLRISRNFLSWYDDEEITDTIGHLINLNELSFSGTRFTSLPETVGALVHLKELRIEGNRLMGKSKLKLPESMGKLIHLEELAISSSDLDGIPQSIGRLNNLAVLYLPGNKITHLPDSIGDLENLKELYLGTSEINESRYYNNLKNLPESLGSLVNLNTMDLSNNKLASLPNSIGNLINLTTLDLSNNDLSTLPESFGNLYKLESLNLDGNNLNYLPEAIYNLKSLKYLSLNGNGLINLSKNINKMTNLVSLKLGTYHVPGVELITKSNKLQDLPDEIYMLKNLTYLDLDHNHISELSENIVKLENLEYLSLFGNKLVNLPDGIKALKRLGTIDMRSNPLKEHA